MVFTFYYSVIFTKFIRELTLWSYYITKQSAVKDQFTAKETEGNLLFELWGKPGTKVKGVVVIQSYNAFWIIRTMTERYTP